MESCRHSKEYIYNHIIITPVSHYYLVLVFHLKLVVVEAKMVLVKTLILRKGHKTKSSATWESHQESLGDLLLQHFLQGFLGAEHRKRLVLKIRVQLTQLIRRLIAVS